MIIPIELSDIEVAVLDERRGEMSREDFMLLHVQPISPEMELQRIEMRNTRRQRAEQARRREEGP